MEEKGRESKKLRQKYKGRNGQGGEAEMAEEENGNTDVADKTTEIQKGRKDRRKKWQKTKAKD